ncbi:MAG: flap endonuclease-1 [Candidatus Woesearchaeota archaeon]|jgi:flap endonuclease-1|nr:flap endonuclease-1 [Candidatus Woesearchaeota archaeon]MDP7622978.1 flap endonuclease-1 [Candidatus Woesearchaeota archaeon]HJN56391.1 flap endonuclease-1 [Candidatus Woesearchaeota archaeon]|tara:strand:+ start:19481 stop:20512 length:1032 start_codon:yes stop_codon:yes gene_type:complete
MGVAFKGIIVSQETDLDFFKNKIIILDAHNILYQFITTIRGRDGSQLMDSKGNITSHLVGLFTRTANLMQRGIKIAFVFDGKPPELKQKTREQRKKLKLDAERKFQEAKKRGDEEEMKKYASRTSRLTKDMIEESKKLISSMGLPVVQAPSEGEAQASYMVKENHGFAVGSQDFDSLIHGATRLARNLSVAGRRKKGNTIGYETIKPELIGLSENLHNLGIDSDQLIALSIIIGTDYNPGGIKGIGPKNALKLVKKHKNDFDSLFKEVKWDDFFQFSWEEVYYLIKKMPVTDDFKLGWGNVKKDELYKLLVDKHDFSEQRVNSTLQKINNGTAKKQQKSLSDF